MIMRVSVPYFNLRNFLVYFLSLEIDDESITSEDDVDQDESSMQMEESINRHDSEKQKADALKKQIGKFCSNE